jgi:hypothetical protein
LKGGNCTRTKVKNREIRFVKICPRQIEEETLEEIRMRARVLESLPKKFSSELYDRLTMPISMEELHLATKFMAINKSLSPYGVVVEFYLFLGGR